MTERKFFDFDAFWESQSKPSVSIRVFGVDHVLPPSLPAKLVLHRERVLVDLGESGDVSVEEVAQMSRTLFGEKRVDDWLLRDDFGIDKLYDLFRHTMKLYAARGDAEGEADPPVTGATSEQTPKPSGTSSSTGDSSSPTSSASTG